MNYWQVLVILFLSSCAIALVFATGIVRVNVSDRSKPKNAEVRQTEPLFRFDDGSISSKTDSAHGSARILGESTTEEPEQTSQVTTSTYNAPTPYPTMVEWQPVHPPGPRDVSSYLNRMGDLFTKIADLNGSAEVSLGMMGVAAESLEPCSREEWSQEFLPNGERNPSFILDPYVVDELYQSCLQTNQEIVDMWAPDTESIKGQIDSYHAQIEDIKNECNDSQCNDFYWEFVNEFQNSGWYVR